MNEIRIHVIPTANDDGTDGPPVTVANVQSSLAKANAAFADAGIKFVFNPNSDLSPRQNSTLLNFDTTVLPGTNLDSPADQEPPQEWQTHEAERNRVANQFPGKLVIFYCGANKLFHNGTRWEHRPAGSGGFSGGNLQFVRMAFDASGVVNTIPHEIGHYFYLNHTHTEEHDPKWQNLEGVKRAIKWWVDDQGHDPVDGLGVWDGDQRADDPALPVVRDTPADPKPDMYKLAGLDICNPGQELTVTVALASGPRDYTFSPDRRNVMSYWDTDCAGGAHLTPNQVARVQAALKQENRKHLTATRVLYDAVLGSAGRGQTRALGWALTDFAQRFDAEQAAGKHLVTMDAFQIAPGEVRWNGVWEPGNRKQTRAIGWTHNDFLARIDKEFQSRRLVHMQAYNIDNTPGGVRYDGVWEPASFAQSTALGWTFADILTRFQEELAVGNHITHLQAVSLDGTIAGMRYDAIFESGDTGQTFVIGYERSHFNERNNRELLQGRHLVHMQSYDIGANQYRYDAIWEPGNPRAQGVATGWELEHLIARAANEGVQGRGIARLQVQSLPGATLRWDAIFEKQTGSQRRLLGLSLAEMADHLSPATLADRHIAHLRGYLIRK